MVIMRRDEAAKKCGYSSQSYIWALEEGLLPNYTPGVFLQQDNAKIHVSRLTQAFLERHGIWVIDWPSHNPDLNPIEHVWKKMKDILHMNYPYLCYLKNNILDEEKFEAALKDSWDKVPQDFIDKLIDSMHRRLEAVRKAKGWYTKY